MDGTLFIFEAGIPPFWTWKSFVSYEPLIWMPFLFISFISFWLCLFCRNFYKRKKYCFVYAALYIAGQDNRRADFKGQTGVSARPFDGLGVLRRHRNNWSLRARSAQIKALKIWALAWVGVRSVVILLINYSTLHELFDRRPESELMYSSHNPVLRRFRKSRNNARIKLSPLLRVKAICQTGLATSGRSSAAGWDLQTGLSWFKSTYREVRPCYIDPYSSPVFTNETLHSWDEHWPRADSPAGYLISKGKNKGTREKVLSNVFPSPHSKHKSSKGDALLRSTLEMNERI